MRGMNGSMRVPSDQIKLFEITLMWKARENAVVSQALGGAVAGASEVLQNILRTKDEVSLIRISQIGLLLHSVSLLSTRGKELCMIDDFAGAYDSLNCNITIQPFKQTIRDNLKLKYNNDVILKVIDLKYHVNINKNDSKNDKNDEDDMNNIDEEIEVILFIDSEEHSDW
eukprot:CAMPEP_0114347378 /NCGR_PEP_ID=MMETSP0101-20121206/13838_1 /TAXON_ID=38822 ORGANISM="Pteridomonas danica, Strain PT" /NCGR_SAMPLE_ID=MMETSP0101 /ASSEMBLY_ACC=CAM_ASM_000211 /LENGTH=169 /DNA_ID=CAMNT_0001484623 /DNA_START=113 /DNA_END=619 /DNA_ORIENTATION=+